MVLNLNVSAVQTERCMEQFKNLWEQSVIFNMRRWDFGSGAKTGQMVAILNKKRHKKFEQVQTHPNPLGPYS